MAKTTDGGLAALGCTLAMVMLPLNILIRAWAAHVLWGWFVVPTFHLATPSYAAIMGLSGLITLFMPYPTSAKTDENVEPQDRMRKALGNLAVGTFIVPVFVVALGYLYHAFL